MIKLSVEILLEIHNKWEVSREDKDDVRADLIFYD